MAKADAPPPKPADAPPPKPADAPPPKPADAPPPKPADAPPPKPADAPPPKPADAPPPKPADAPPPKPADAPPPKPADAPPPKPADAPPPKPADAPPPKPADAPPPKPADAPPPKPADAPPPKPAGAAGGRIKESGASAAPAGVAGELETAKAEAEASAERLRAAQAAADEILEEEYRKTAESLKRDKPHDSFTDYRTADIIFRRDLGEPEFWLDKRERAPMRLVISDDEAREISRRVEIPTDQTPRYDPQYILSKEYGGTSNYEVGISAILGEALEGVEALRKAGAGDDAVRRAELDVEKLACMYQNYHIGMNVFRTAKGGRDRAKK